MLCLIIGSLRKLLTHLISILVGISHGALISTLVAAERAQDIAAMVLSLLLSMLPTSSSRVCKSSATQIFLRYPIRSPKDHTVGKRYIADAFNSDIPTAQRAYAGPVLIIHGTADTVVPGTVIAETAQKTFPHAQLMSIDGADHSISDFVSVGQTLKT